MSEPDDTELSAEVGDGADHTAVIPDTSETKAAQLAWSIADNAPDVTSAAERQPLPLSLKILLGCVAVGAVTLVAFVIGHRGFPGSPQHASAPNAAPAVKSPGAATAANSPRPARADALTPTAQSAAESIRAAIPQVTELIEITEDNDPNHLIGRPNGYVAASVLVDSRLPGCTSTSTNLGDDCGAVIEQWPDQAAAQRRDDYVQSILRTMPMLGQQWTTVKGNLLLRVTGQLKPSAAEAYKAAFTA
jgi:serine/threonine-protein kinase